MNRTTQITTREQKRLEARAQAYSEYLNYAKREIADSIIKHGFTELHGVIERLLHVYRQFQKDHPR